MPETRLAKTRASLPEGYQFGDAGRAAARHDALEAEWYASMRPVQWNVIEGEHFASDADNHPVQEGERVE